jgi:opacity protein-like surface antigen
MKIFIGILITLCLIWCVHHAHAEDKNNASHIQLVHRDTVGDDVNNPNRNGINITQVHRLADNFSIDVNGQYREQNGYDKNNSTRFEFGATPHNDFFYIRTALGAKSQGDTHLYYSLEPGLMWKLSNNILVKTGYRYRDSFNNDKNDTTHAARIGVEYALTNTQSITAGYERSFGDSEWSGLSTGYAVRF